MFNRKAASRKSRPDEVLQSLPLEPGTRVADIGSGGGYFTLRFAEAVGRDGMVYAVDTDPELLAYVEKSASEKGLENVRTALAKTGPPPIHEAILDLVFMRNVTHHIDDRPAYLAEVRRLLAPKGRLAIIEYLETKGVSFRGIFRHYVPKETLIKETESAGYRLEEDLTFLPEQSFTIYSVADQ
jgi:arsenite methyltransferase